MSTTGTSFKVNNFPWFIILIKLYLSRGLCNVHRFFLSHHLSTMIGRVPHLFKYLRIESRAKIAMVYIILLITATAIAETTKKNTIGTIVSYRLMLLYFEFCSNIEAVISVRLFAINAFIMTCLFHTCNRCNKNIFSQVHRPLQPVLMYKNMPTEIS